MVFCMKWIECNVYPIPSLNTVFFLEQVSPHAIWDLVPLENPQSIGATFYTRKQIVSYTTIVLLWK